MTIWLKLLKPDSYWKSPKITPAFALPWRWMKTLNYITRVLISKSEKEWFLSEQVTGAILAGVRQADRPSPDRPVMEMSKKQSFARNRDEPCQVGRLTQTTARENRKWKFFDPWRSCHEKFKRSYCKHFTIYDLMLFLKYFDMRQTMCADGWRDQTCGLFEAKAEKELRHHFFPPLPLKADLFWQHIL